MSNLRNWFLGMRVWLYEQQVLWATVAVLIVAGLYVWFWPAASGDDRLRYVGTFLQVLGIATVWAGFEKTRKLFGYEYTVVAFWRWVDRIPYRAQRRDVTVQLSGQAMVITGGTANLSVGTTDTSVEARLAVLEQNVKAMEGQFTKEMADLGTKLRDLRQAHSRVNEDHKANIARVEGRLLAAQTGGLDLSLGGLVWVAAGIIAAGMPQELARAFCLV